MSGYLDAGFLDQRVTLYRYEKSVSGRGTPIERYPEDSIRWGRVEPATGRESSVGLKEGTRIDALLVLRDDLVVGNFWLARVDGLLYRVLAPLRRRAQGVRYYLLQYAEEALPTTVAS
jgi:head-tail adaptor